MIEVAHLTKYFGLQPALREVSFQAAKGEILGFLGPNGAGKTTAMRILTGYLPASSGQASVAGFDVFEHPQEVKRRTGYLPESVPLYLGMEVSRYLRFVAELKGVHRRSRTQRVREVVEQCGLGEVRDRLIGKISKGFRQRVGLAQALIGHPEVLILDEPTVGLDPKQIIEIRQLIRSLGGERTVILSTHILPEVSMTCERVIILSQGQVMAVDTPENLQHRLQKGGRIAVVVDGPPETVLDVLRRIPGVARVHGPDGQSGQPTLSAGTAPEYLVETEPDRDLRRSVAEAMVGARLGLLELRSVGMSLEDIFIKLVTEEEVLS